MTGSTQMTGIFSLCNQFGTWPELRRVNQGGDQRGDEGLNQSWSIQKNIGARRIKIINEFPVKLNVYIVSHVLYYVAI